MRPRLRIKRLLHRPQLPGTMNRHIRKKDNRTNNQRNGVNQQRRRPPQPDDLTIGDQCPEATREAILAAASATTTPDPKAP